MANIYVGIDVGKYFIDVACRGAEFEGRFETKASELKKLVRQLAKLNVVRLVLEASGGYERPILKAFSEASIPCVLIQPVRSRQFANALGKRAKTDAIDAAVLAHFAEVAADDLPLWQPLTDDERKLRALVRLRSQVFRSYDTEQKRLDAAEEPEVQKVHRSLVRSLKRQLDNVDVQIKEMKKADSVVGEKLRHLEQTHTGVGFKVAATLVAELPELGQLSRGQAASLVGIAPYARESGVWIGKRFTHGGRASVRRAMYLAALVAVRHDAHLKAFYERLVAKGKPKKVALIACARKLLTRINSLMRQEFFATADAI